LQNLLPDTITPEYILYVYTVAGVKCLCGGRKKSPCTFVLSAVMFSF